jgi:hypothetical protein
MPVQVLNLLHKELFTTADIEQVQNVKKTFTLH